MVPRSVILAQAFAAALIGAPAAHAAAPQSEDTSLAYADCLVRTIAIQSILHTDDEETVMARRIALKCADFYRAIVAEQTRGARSMGVVANYDYALQAVRDRRVPAP